MADSDIDNREELERAFLIARGAAINVYAIYENSLAVLFSHLMGVQPEIGGIPFFRLNNARARMAILEKLLKKRHGDSYNIFWNSLVKNHVRPIDEQRNRIVHWVAAMQVRFENNHPLFTSINLIPPNYWDRVENSPSETIASIDEFTAKCSFLAELISDFHRTLSDRENVDPSLREIFQKPIAYPPPDNHPTVQRLKGPGIRPRSSRA